MWSSTDAAAVPVYPRWRGEHFVMALFAAVMSGLSPLARGTLNLVQQFGIVTRFIPAGAGNTMVWFLPLYAGPVYPRWRGEHTRFLSLSLAVSGLSPLPRGTP